MPKNKYNVGDTLQTEEGEIILVRGISSEISENGECFYSGFIGPEYGGTKWAHGIAESNLKPYKKKVRKYQWAVHVGEILIIAWYKDS